MYKAIFSKKYSLLISWLIQTRKEKKISQRELASILGVHHSIVGKIEVRERRLDVIEYIQYCQALDADPIVGLQRVVNKQ